MTKKAPPAETGLVTRACRRLAILGHASDSTMRRAVAMNGTGRPLLPEDRSALARFLESTEARADGIVALVNNRVKDRETV